MSEDKNPVGRPRNQDAQALDDILLSKEKREALFKELKRFAKEKDLHKQRAKSLQEDIKAISKDTFNLSVKKFNELIDAYDSGALDEKIDVLTTTVDTLTILKESTENE